MAILTKTDGALGLIPRPKLDIITDPVTKQKFFRDTSVPGSTYQPYTGDGTQTGKIAPIAETQPLPSVIPQPVQPQIDPLTKFNNMVFTLLQNAKAGQLAKKSGFEELQAANAMAPASELGIEGLTPSDMISARERLSEQYKPAISNINDRVQMFNDTLKYAKDLGDVYWKNVQPSEETIEAVRRQLKAGFVPSEDVLAKTGKYLTEDDWMAAAAAKKTAGGEGKPLNILDVQRYNELYPNAGVVAGDTEATANAKVAASISPIDFKDEKLRQTARDSKNIEKKTYEQTISEIDANPLIKNKDRAKLIAGEIYEIDKKKQGFFSRLLGGEKQKTEWKPAGTINLESEKFFGDLNAQINEFNKNFIGQ